MKFVFYANTDWYLYNFRLSTALRLKSEGHEVVMLSPPGEYGERFAAHDLRWIRLAMDRSSLNPFREAALISSLTRLLRQERPDLLHNFTVKCAVYGAIAARAAGVPAVVNAVAGMGYVFASDRLLARSPRGRPACRRWSTRWPAWATCSPATRCSRARCARWSSC